jgi:hypothetical protein
MTPAPAQAPMRTLLITHRCEGWTDDIGRLRGWAPEMA